jgi:transposase
MELSASEVRRLRELGRRGEPAYVRVKALALWNLGRGVAVGEVAQMFGVSRQSLWDWRRHWRDAGEDGLRVSRGRGRKVRADLKELVDYVRQSPRFFGLSQTRWSLSALARVVPSLRGFTPFGVQKVLRRAGFAYKRGQPHLHSPDPAYAVKKKTWSKL